MIFNKSAEIKKDDIVPDQVLFGLMLGSIFGPLRVLPNKNAELSFKKLARIIIKKTFLFSALSITKKINIEQIVNIK